MVQSGSHGGCIGPWREPDKGLVVTAGPVDQPFLVQFEIEEKVEFQGALRRQVFKDGADGEVPGVLEPDRLTYGRGRATEEDNGRLAGQSDVADILQGSRRGTGDQRVAEHPEEIFSCPGTVQLYHFVPVPEGFGIAPGKIVARSIISKAGDVGDSLFGPVQQESWIPATLGGADRHVVIASRLAIGDSGFIDGIKIATVGMEI